MNTLDRSKKSIKPNNESQLELFELAAGSVPGRRHIGCGNLLAGRNNQDACNYHASDEAIILSVHDGCGSTAYSELGARLAANLLPVCILDTIHLFGSNKIENPLFWQHVQELCLAKMATIVSLCSQEGTHNSDSKNAFAKSHLLFTVLGALITDELTVIFGIGDGTFSINGKTTSIAFPDNAPDYLCKVMISPTEPSNFVLHAMTRTENLETLMLGTDGVQDLINASEKKIPGKSRSVGSIPELFKQDFLFNRITTGEAQQSKTPMDTLTGWLRQINSEVTKLAQDEDNNHVLRREEGLLPDDTTLVLLRRNR